MIKITVQLNEEDAIKKTGVIHIVRPDGTAIVEEFEYASIDIVAPQVQTTLERLLEQNPAPDIQMNDARSVGSKSKPARKQTSSKPKKQPKKPAGISDEDWALMAAPAQNAYFAKESE